MEGACWYSDAMPKRTKKLLVYLDQNFISEMAKADINDKVKPEWKDLYRLLKEGFLDEKFAFFEIERVNHSRGQPHRQTITPFGYLHQPSLIYIVIVYLKQNPCNSLQRRFTLHRG